MRASSLPEYYSNCQNIIQIPRILCKLSEYYANFYQIWYYPVRASSLPEYCSNCQNIMQISTRFGIIYASRMLALGGKNHHQMDGLGRHPQIPELLAYFTQDNRQYLLQEFIDGKNLQQELEESGAFDKSQILELLKSLLPVLEFIHSKRVIHRDIKPENIIRRKTDNQYPVLASSSPENIILVDFGAAKYATMTALAVTGTVIGSAGYVAPEQAVGKATFASDIYRTHLVSLKN